MLHRLDSLRDSWAQLNERVPIELYPGSRPLGCLKLPRSTQPETATFLRTACNKSKHRTHRAGNRAAPFEVAREFPLRLQLHHDLVRLLGALLHQLVIMQQNVHLLPD